ncbi:Synergin gamma [Ophiophagus hannah]|uniref:Synergin gamma n=1 Tax=Ophiophagus hannah TaxID=8665 RepID=V8NW52_OPHHA|nr:Synergin gamma [Ophiophagus hannah]
MFAADTQGWSFVLLFKCHFLSVVIGKANEILAGISQPSVCREVLLSAPGTAYIWGTADVPFLSLSFS